MEFSNSLRDGITSFISRVITVTVLDSFSGVFSLLGYEWVISALKFVVILTSTLVLDKIDHFHPAYVIRYILGFFIIWAALGFNVIDVIVLLSARI